MAKTKVGKVLEKAIAKGEKLIQAGKELTEALRELKDTIPQKEE